MEKRTPGVKVIDENRAITDEIWKLNGLEKLRENKCC